MGILIIVGGGLWVDAGWKEAWHGKGRGVVSGRQEAFGLERMAGGNDKRAK